MLNEIQAKEIPMSRRIVTLVVFSSLLAGALAAQQAPPPQYPVMEGIAQEIIQKYQTTSCQQLAAEKQQPPAAQQAQAQDKAIQMLRQDPAMRKAFIDRVAAPIANKMFECGMIP